jgi:hypothetical protein
MDPEEACSTWRGKTATHTSHQETFVACSMPVFLHGPVSGLALTFLGSLWSLWANLSKDRSVRYLVRRHEIWDRSEPRGAFCPLSFSFQLEGFSDSQTC